MENNAFEMPAGDVIVTARFKAKAEEPKQHSVTVTVKNDQGGTATADPNQAAAGQTVKLDIQPKDGWTVDKVTVNGEPLEPTVPVTQLGYQFVMPDEDAEVVVEFFNSGSTGTEE